MRHHPRDAIEPYTILAEEQGRVCRPNIRLVEEVEVDGLIENCLLYPRAAKCERA